MIHEIEQIDGSGASFSLDGWEASCRSYCDNAMVRNNRNGLKKVHSSVQDAALHERIPMGIKGTLPFSFGGGQQGNFKNP